MIVRRTSAGGGLRSTPMRGVGSSGDRPGDGSPAVDARGRTVMVVSEDIELAVALRDRLDRSYVTVCGVRIGEAEAAVRGCSPWPWMVIGDGAGLTPATVQVLARHPMLLLWRGPPPPRLPAHTRRVKLFSELAAAVEAALGAEVGGIRLAPGAGVTLPDGRHNASAALEVLVASHPRPLFAAAHHFRAVDATLEAHAVPLHVARTAAGGVLLDARAA